MYAITEFATVVLDAAGTVECCNAAADDLFGVGSGKLVGRELAGLVPGVPIRPETPGYNIAYATFSAGCGSVRSALVRRSDGSALHVNIRFERPQMRDSRSIMMVLGLAENDAAASGRTLPEKTSLCA